MAERFHFKWSQSSGESIGDYLASFRCIANCYKFGDFLEEVLGDCLVLSENISAGAAHKHQALEIAQGMEATAVESNELTAILVQC